RYHLPLWITEFALANFGGATPSFPTQAQQAAFLTAATTMLDGLPYVQRYAWFALPTSAGSGTTGLFGAGAVATPVGRAFEAARLPGYPLTVECTSAYSFSAAIVRWFSLSKREVISGRTGPKMAGIVMSSTSHRVTWVAASLGSSE